MESPAAPPKQLQPPPQQNLPHQLERAVPPQQLQPPPRRNRRHRHSRRHPRAALPQQVPPPRTQNVQNHLLLASGVASRLPMANRYRAALHGHISVCNDSMHRPAGQLSKQLNPFAKEFVPPFRTEQGSASLAPASNGTKQIENWYNHPVQQPYYRMSREHQEEKIRRTVYVSQLGRQVTELQMAALFMTCGKIVDCRVCGDPSPSLRKAFVEFADEEGARAALCLGGIQLGDYRIRVLPSRTAIKPVNKILLPLSEEEREMCTRTVYCTNIDKELHQAHVKQFFEQTCGEVAQIRLLEPNNDFPTQIAFVEFVMAKSATAALDCSGDLLGSRPIRVSPSKTPVIARS